MRHPALEDMLGVLVVVEEHDNGLPTPCSYIRIIQPLRHAAEHEQIRFALVSANAVTRYTADAVLTHRFAFQGTKQIDRLIAHCRNTGMPLIYDLDDNMFCLPSNHADRAFIKMRINDARRLLGSSDEVWASTARLAGQLSTMNKHVEIFENCFNPSCWPLRRPRDRSGPCRFIYIGTVTHGADLNMVLPAFDAVWRRKPGSFELYILGVTTEQIRRPWVHRYRAPTPHPEIYPAFAAALSSDPAFDFDVGIAPLVDTPFNQAKSAIKFLEYAALGLAPILSEVGAYPDAVEPGIDGLLVRNTTEVWVEAIERMIDDEAFCRNLADAAQAKSRKLPDFGLEARRRTEQIRKVKFRVAKR